MTRAFLSLQGKAYLLTCDSIHDHDWLIHSLPGDALPDEDLLVLDRVPLHAPLAPAGGAVPQELLVLRVGRGGPRQGGLVGFLVHLEVIEKIWNRYWISSILSQYVIQNCGIYQGYWKNLQWILNNNLQYFSVIVTTDIVTNGFLWHLLVNQRGQKWQFYTVKSWVTVTFTYCDIFIWSHAAVCHNNREGLYTCNIYFVTIIAIIQHLGRCPWSVLNKHT